MIVTEPDLTWKRIAIGDAGRGGHFTEYRCVEHPRLTRLVQRPNDSAPYVVTYHVEGIAAQHYADPVDALAAMRANPLPCRCDATGCAVSVGDELFEGHVCRESAP